MSNVKKVIGRVVDYLGDVSCISLILNEGELAQSVGERGRDVGRLLQLVLAAAVNCPSKEGYIQRIMALEEEVQHVVMKAIQEVRTLTNFFSVRNAALYVSCFIRSSGTNEPILIQMH